jgi:hypothetical protein
LLSPRASDLILAAFTLKTRAETIYEAKAKAKAEALQKPDGSSLERKKELSQVRLPISSRNPKSDERGLAM